MEESLHFNNNDFHDFMVLFRQIHDLVDMSEEHKDILSQVRQLQNYTDELQNLTDLYESKVQFIKDIREKHRKNKDNIKNKYRKMSLENLIWLDDAKKDFSVLKRHKCSAQKAKDIVNKYIKK